MVPPLIPHCFDHVWNLKRLSIIILVSRRNEEREKKKERKKINKKESSSSPGRVRVIIERGTRHLPVKSTHVAARGWKILEPIFQTKALLRGSSTCLTRVITHFNGRQIMLVARVVRPFLKIGRKGERKRERERESRDVWKAKVCSMGGRLFRSWRATIHGFEDGAGIPQELNRA